MSLQARIALNDCRFALGRHTVGLQAEAFRTSWVGVVTLLRTVGHVLRNVDAARSPHLKAAVDAGWDELVRTKPEPAIFWGFIVDERNQVLKQYRLGPKRIGRFGPVRPGSVNLGFDLGGMRGKHGSAARITGSPPLQVTSVMDNGPFIGKEEREVAAEAIRWWERYLEGVELDARRRAAC